MTERPVWLDHPIADTPEAAAAASMGAEKPVWESHPTVDTPPTTPAAPAAGYDLFLQSRNELNRGLTYGLSDKAVAALIATMHEVGLKSPKDTADQNDNWLEAYHKNLESVRKEGEQFSETNPIASNAAKAAGLVGGAAMLLPVGGEIPAAAGLLPKLAAGAKAGATAGALSGFGASKDESVLGDVAATGMGAATGAGIGAAGAGLADRVVSPIYNWVARRFSPAAVENQAVQAIAKRMTQDTKAGGPTAQDMLDLMVAAPEKPQTIADVAGENVKQYAGNLTRQPGEARLFARDALNQRDIGAGPRIATDIDQGISSGGSAYDTNEALMQARGAAAQPRYDAAFQQQKVWSPRLQNFLEDPVMQQGMRRGMELERIDSVTHDRPFNPTQMGVDLDAEGNVKFRDVANMRVLDAGKRGLDSMIADERNPITGRLSQRGVALDQFRRAYLGELDSLDSSGTYAGARAAWAGPSASMDAVRAGQAVLSRRPEEIAADVTRLRHQSPGDLEFYRLGAADALKEKIARTGMGGDEAKRLIGNQYTQQQLRPLFDTQKDYDRFISSVTAENRMFETRQRLIGGSQTAERLAENGGNEGATGHAIRGAVALAEGAPGAAGLSAMKALGALTRGESPAVNSAAARMLFRPQTDPRVFQSLRDVLTAQEARTRPRVVSIPLSSAVGANPVPTLANVLAAGQYLPTGHQ
jgi:hypothetical protein